VFWQAASCQKAPSSVSLIEPSVYVREGRQTNSGPVESQGGAREDDPLARPGQHRAENSTKVVTNQQVSGVSEGVEFFDAVLKTPVWRRAVIAQPWNLRCGQLPVGR